MNDDDSFDIGRKILISQLERVFHDYVINNGRNIRYPIKFEDNTELKGKYTLKVTPDSEGLFYSGKYIFGANSLMIYQAIDALLKELSNRGLLDDICIWTKEKKLQDEYNIEFDLDDDSW